MIRFQVSKPVLAGREKEYVLDAVESGWISSNGPYIERFERSVSQILGVEQCIATSNGTVAMHLACLALGLQAGQKVIVPSLTYVATANAVAYCGGIPVMADCDRHTWNMTAAQVEANITPETVGVIAVHLYGLPGQVDEIAAVCRKHGLWLLEDCAESLGATLNGQQTGTFGDAAAFSFYGNKTISTGEGGMLVVRDPERRAHARLLRGQGMDPARRYWHPVIGYNYRLTNVAAAIGCGQIDMIDYHLGERRRIARTYRRELDHLAAAGLVALPGHTNHAESSYWLFSIVLSDGGAARRARIMARLELDYGIETRPFFVPMHHLPMYQQTLDLPNTEYLGHHGMNLPTYSGLTDSEIAEIAAAISAVVRSER